MPKRSMNLLEAYGLTGSYPAAAEIAVDLRANNHEVGDAAEALHVLRRAAELARSDGTPRKSIIDPFRANIEELVERSRGRIRTDVVRERLVAMGFGGIDRTTAGPCRRRRRLRRSA